MEEGRVGMESESGREIGVQSSQFLGGSPGDTSYSRGSHDNDTTLYDLE